MYSTCDCVQRNIGRHISKKIHVTLLYKVHCLKIISHKYAIESKCFEMRSLFFRLSDNWVLSFSISYFSKNNFYTFRDNKYYKIIVFPMCPILFNFSRGIIKFHDWSQSIHNLLFPVSFFFFILSITYVYVGTEMSEQTTSPFTKTNHKRPTNKRKVKQ